MTNDTLYWVMFAVRCVILAIIIHKYGWRGVTLTMLYAIAEDLTPSRGGV